MKSGIRMGSVGVGRYGSRRHWMHGRAVGWRDRFQLVSPDGRLQGLQCRQSVAVLRVQNAWTGNGGRATGCLDWLYRLTHRLRALLVRVY